LQFTAFYHFRLANMGFLKKGIGILYSIYAFTVFLAVMFLIMPIVIIAPLFGKIVGGNIIYKLCRFWADTCFFLFGIRHTGSKDYPHDEKKQYIFVSNHISFLDIPVIFKAIRRQPIRILGKYEMSRIPVFGYLYKNAVVMVNREDVTSRAKSILQLKAFIRKGFSVFICPEGTFNMTHQPLKEFYDGAFRIAIETQTPLKPILFLDTYDRLNYNSIFSLTPGKCRTVYLQEISVEGLTVDDTKDLKQKTYDIMQEALIRYKAGWINTG
jgi:1-acyl-sn-glycerol-3-phosphate acyltransferase